MDILTHFETVHYEEITVDSQRELYRVITGLEKDTLPLFLTENDIYFPAYRRYFSFEINENVFWVRKYFP